MNILFWRYRYGKRTHCDQRSIHWNARSCNNWRRLSWCLVPTRCCNCAHIFACNDLLINIFGNIIISHRSEFQWPARSTDHSPLDYFLQGYVKQMIFNAKPDTLSSLKQVVREITSSINWQRYSSYTNLKFTKTV